MYGHHRQVIQRLTEYFRDDPRFLALIIGGSVAKGLERQYSDIDFVVIAADEEYERRAAIHDLHIYSQEFSDYPGGYVDGKVFNCQFLADIARRGTEPARWAFKDAFIAYSHMPNLDDILKRIPVYQEHERKPKIRAFYSQTYLHYLMSLEAVNDISDNTYLKTQRVMELLLFGARLILAHNRVLYPYHKWLRVELERAPEKPDNFLTLFEVLLASPSAETIQAYWDAVEHFQDWGIDKHQAVTQFMADAEWDWRDGKAALRDS
jgi:hypothetical protein